jgi:hypothetical protein
MCWETIDKLRKHCPITNVLGTIGKLGKRGGKRRQKTKYIGSVAASYPNHMLE